MNDRRDVTGVWYGRWTSADPRVAPNSFIATLTEEFACVFGSTSERDRLGAGLIGADVDGTRSGGRLEFTKRYNGGRLSHSVHYAGRINAAGTDIAGDWRFSHYSGSFTMMREIFDGLKVEDSEQVENKVPERAR